MRLYAIQHSTEYFAAARVASKGCQLLLGIQAPEILCLFFSDSGEFLKVETKAIPLNSTHEAVRNMIASWIAELNAVPGTIHVDRFSIPERAIELRNLPDYLQEFVDNPTAFDEERRNSLSRCLESWRKDGNFVLVWDEDYEMNSIGEVEST